MSKATYLQALTEWTGSGSPGLAPSSAVHGISLSDVTSAEDAQARDAGDPRPSAVSGWTWWDGSHEDLHAWHRAIRAAHQGGPTFTSEERKRADSLYLQNQNAQPRPARRKRSSPAPQEARQ